MEIDNLTIGEAKALAAMFCGGNTKRPDLGKKETEMEIDNLTIGEAKALAAMFCGGNEKSASTPHIGRKCIIRTYASGVHFGTLISHNGRQVELADARRLWKWHALYGISLSEVAMGGINQDKSRVCQTVPEMTILDALEIIPTTDTAAETIINAPVA